MACDAQLAQIWVEKCPDKYPRRLSGARYFLGNIRREGMQKGMSGELS